MTPKEEAKDDLKRFYSKVKKTSKCHNWIGANVKGYGQFWHINKVFLAHRWIYEALVKKIPSGMTIDHICRNKKCVNTNHLRVLSLRDNILISDSPTAKNHRKIYCNKNHEFSRENTIITKSGGRNCRECKNAFLREKRKRRTKEEFDKERNYKKEWRLKNLDKARENTRRYRERLAKKTSNQFKQALEQIKGGQGSGKGGV